MALLSDVLLQVLLPNRLLGCCRVVCEIWGYAGWYNMILWQNAQHAFGYYKIINKDLVTLASAVQCWFC